MNKEVRQSKIYSYFHGAGNVFQQFIVIVGILFILMGFAANLASEAKLDNARDKYNELRNKASQIEEEYDNLYDTYRNSPALNLVCDKFEEAQVVENDKHQAEKEALNAALKSYNDTVSEANALAKAIDESELGKNLISLKSACNSIYTKYKYRLSCDFGNEAVIKENDKYTDEKTQYNDALKEYLAAEKAVAENADAKKHAELTKTAETLKGDYEALYKQYTGSEYRFSCEKLVKNEIESGDKYAAEKKELNEIAAKYEKAAEKASKAGNKLDKLRYGTPASTILFLIAGGLVTLVGLIWSIIKKNSFDKGSCEAAYDEEIQIKIEEAKEKALEKLNIVAEQIDKVEPVVLNGIAHEAETGKKATAGVAGLVNVFTYLCTVLLGAIAAAIYAGISILFGGAFFIPAIGSIALAAFLGYKMYNKFEKDSYINPKEIQRLEKLNPSLKFRLGTDNVMRVSLPAITVYMFGEEQLYMYYQYIDIVTGKIFCEGIREYFYEDIVGVISSQETKTVFRSKGLFKAAEAIEYLKESITVVTSGCQHSESYIVPTGNSLLDTSFVGMRNLIRQKKSDAE